MRSLSWTHGGWCAPRAKDVARDRCDLATEHLGCCRAHASALQRRRDGLRCLNVELRETEIDTLIRRGLLNNETRNDPGAIMDALYAFLDSTLGATP
jgi:hypothetical protein